MKLALQLAYKNLVGAGLRTWLNVFILAFAFIVIIFYNGMIDGWNQQARRDSIAWEYGQGQVIHPNYDAFDPFTIQDSHQEWQGSTKNLTPILLQQASIYPDDRMLSVLLKGIDTQQETLLLPTQILQTSEADIPVIIGQKMADITNLQKGDEVLLRWRDKHGAFDANMITVVDIFKTDVPTVDAGQIWMSLEKLQTLTGLENEVTMLVANENFDKNTLSDSWLFKTQDDLLASLDEMIAMKKAGGSFTYILLLALALIAIFDTQVLSIFRRQKEIGTYVALGMTKRQVVGLFTIEGSMYSLLAMLVGILLGTPLFIYIAQTGIPLPEGSQDMGVVVAERIFPVYGIGLIVGTIIIVMLAATLVSFLPARKIAKINPVDALKGKMS